MSIHGDDRVKIDKAHSKLLTGLVTANKPRDILELGLGGGESCDAILEGLEYNGQDYKYTIVDNWHDWGGALPQVVLDKYGDKCNIRTSTEEDFVYDTRDKYDFIMSDGDHHNTDQWFHYVYRNLLRDNGILVYHDVNLFSAEFPNLRNIYHNVRNRNISHHLFNSNSLEGERCHRGLLVIFKPNIWPK